MKPKILCVDDDPNFLNIFGEHFENNNWTVIYASNGREAIEKFAVFMPDIIALDVIMPDLNGFETLEIIRDYIMGYPYLPFFISFIEDIKLISKSLSKFHAIEYFTKRAFRNDPDYVLRTIESKYRHIKSARESASVSKLPPHDIKTLISSKIWSGFSGILEIFCENGSFTIRFEGGKPWCIYEDGSSVKLGYVLEQIRQNSECEVKIIDEMGIKNIVSSRVGLLLKSVNILFGNSLNFMVKNAKSGEIIHTTVMGKKLENIQSIANASYNWHSGFQLVGEEIEYIDFLADKFAGIFYPINSSYDLVVSFDRSRWRDFERSLHKVLRNKILLLNSILKEEVIG